MERSIEKYLEEWKFSPNRKPMILRGARQVGKTYIVEKFGKTEFEFFLNLNFERDKTLETIFNEKNPQKIINDLSGLYSIPILEGKTLLFIDEIQISPNAIASLRYFYEDIPGLHVIAAGSLLDHTLNEIQYSMPIGRVEYAYLYPLSFIEFLTAFGESGLCDVIRNFEPGKELIEAIHLKLSDYLRLYFIVGGMPEAVQTYINSKNLIEVEKVHASIVTSLQYDFSKYGTRAQQDHLRKSLHYVANSIGQKVKYVNIDNKVHSTLLKDALHKLEMSRVIHLIRRTKSVHIPITQYVDNNTFKPILMDIGLVSYLVQIKINSLNNLISDYGGALAEQFVGQEMIASSPYYKEMKLYYWAREEKNSNAEIDYLIQKSNEIYPIEVKAGKTGTLKSLQVFLGSKDKQFGIRFNLNLPTMGNNLEATIRVKNKSKQIEYSLLSLPMYFAGNIHKFRTLTNL